MAEVETYIKWGLIGGVTIFSMYLLYKFGEGQGWWTFRPRLTRMRSR